MSFDICCSCEQNVPSNIVQPFTKIALLSITIMTLYFYNRIRLPPCVNEVRKQKWNEVNFYFCIVSVSCCKSIRKDNETSCYSYGYSIVCFLHSFGIISNQNSLTIGDYYEATYSLIVLSN
jgi:hypothetical protein